MVEGGSLEKVQVVEGEGVGHAVSGVEGPVRGGLVSGGGVGVAGSFSDVPSCPLFRLFR